MTDRSATGCAAGGISRRALSAKPAAPREDRLMIQMHRRILGSGLEAIQVAA